VKAERRWLVDAIRDRLIPEFTSRGFEVVPFPKIGPTDWAGVAKNPFGRLRRRSASGFDLVEIDLESYGKAAFRLSIGVSSFGGMKTPNGHIAAEDVLVGWLDEYFVLYQRPWIWSFFPSLANFSVWRLNRSRVTREAYDVLVAQVAGMMWEVELALRERRCGPHVRRVRIDRSKH